jgi:mannose-1-phosphate guanylyltransferase
MVGKVETFLALIEKHLPDLYEIFESARDSFGKSDESSTIKTVYEWIAETNFSREVLEKSAEELFVLRVGDVAWSDWGEPQRVIGTLKNLGVKMAWMHAVAA